MGHTTVNLDEKTAATTEHGSILGRLFGRDGRETSAADAHLGSDARSTLELSDIQGFILRGDRMPMVRHLLLSVVTPAEAPKLLGRMVSGDESDAPQITTAEDWHVGFAPGPGDDPAVPYHKPDYCLNLAIGMIALEIKDRIQRSHSNRSEPSSTALRTARDWWATQDPMIRRTGSNPLGGETITSW
jgi:hypothetical protein